MALTGYCVIYCGQHRIRHLKALAFAICHISVLCAMDFYDFLFRRVCYNIFLILLEVYCLSVSWLFNVKHVRLQNTKILDFVYLQMLLGEQTLEKA